MMMSRGTNIAHVGKLLSLLYEYNVTWIANGQLSAVSVKSVIKMTKGRSELCCFTRKSDHVYDWNVHWHVIVLY